MERRVLTLPRGVDMFFDSRGAERCLRVSWHDGQDGPLMSVWRDETCVGTVRMTRSEALRLLGVLAQGLAESETSTTSSEAG